MPKYFVSLLLLLLFSQLRGQELIDGKYYDNELSFFVIEENIRRTGALEICIVNIDNMCVENLMTGFEVLVYNAQNEIIWKSIWSGRNMRIKFKQKLPDAHTIHIIARAPFVVNKLTTTRIHQDKPMELKYKVQ
ncbi:MAG: hypothetical protein JJU02_14385 [Cryomorphaceae bacterium]|nr:hypothetical protein [Cryomorphaceae bacterium]